MAHSICLEISEVWVTCCSRSVAMRSHLSPSSQVAVSTVSCLRESSDKIATSRAQRQSTSRRDRKSTLSRERHSQFKLANSSLETLPRRRCKRGVRAWSTKSLTSSTSSANRRCTTSRWEYSSQRRSFTWSSTNAILSSWQELMTAVRVKTPMTGSQQSKSSTLWRRTVIRNASSCFWKVRWPKWRILKRNQMQSRSTLKTYATREKNAEIRLRRNKEVWRDWARHRCIKIKKIL